MKRREFIALAGAAATFPHAAFAQQARLPRVALASASIPVSDMSETGTDLVWRTFMAELRRLGLIEGQNVLFERYSTLGVSDPVDLARTIVATRPNLIFVGSSTTITLPLIQIAPNIPVVFTVGDALASGLVTNLAHPGGNLTGANITAGVETEGKRIELLREAVPRATRAGYLDDGATYVSIGHQRVAEAAAAQLGLTLVPGLTQRPYDEAAFKAAFADLTGQGVQMLNLAHTTQIIVNHPLVVAMAKAARLPTCGTDVSFVDAGGMMSYGTNRAVAYQRAAGYVVEIILHGARPGDLPVMQPEKFEFVINLKVAAEFGVQIPQSLLLQATDVRE